MAYPTGIKYQLQGGISGLRPIAEVSDTQQHPLGTVAVAYDFNYGVASFLYLAGVASTDPGDVVCYNLKTGATVRAVSGGATSTGPAAVAMGTCLASQFGWYAVFGAVPVNAATVAADAPLYLTSTAGQIDDAVVGGAKISGIISRAATSSGFATCQLAYPEVSSESAVASVNKITLTVEAENTGANTIEVEGQIEDMAGFDAAITHQVMVRSYAVTNDKGVVFIGGGANPGTLIKSFSPATGVHEAWITTTAAGHFRFAIQNDVAETNLIQVSANNALNAVVKLTFV